MCVKSASCRPHGLLALCVRVGLLDDLLDLFCTCVLDLQRAYVSQIYEESPEAIEYLLEQKLGRLAEDVSDSVESSWRGLEDFVNGVANLAEWDTDQVAAVQEGLEEILGLWNGVLKYSKSSDSSLGNDEVAWLASPDAEKWLMDSVGTMFAPILAFTLRPFVPLDGHRYTASVEAVLKTGPLFHRLGEIAYRLRPGSYCSKFLDTYLRSRPDVTLGCHDGEPVFASLSRVAKSVPMLRFAIAALAEPANRNEESEMVRDVAQSITKNGALTVDWTRLQKQLNSCPEDSAREVEQGLPKNLHSWIVKFLEERQEVTSWSKLCRSAGIEIDLSPERLPPGRIVAYAPGKAFLRRSRSLYALREWIETETYRRGRIARTRVVTPLENKSIVAAMSLFEEAFAAEPAISTYGFVSGFHMAEYIARKLPDRPTELYYVTLIQDKVELQLSNFLCSAGRGYFVHPEKLIERDPNTSLVRWRYQQAAALLKATGPLKSVILNLPEPVQIRFRHFLSI